jgi:hypothetical protein
VVFVGGHRRGAFDLPAKTHSIVRIGIYEIFMGMLFCEALLEVGGKTHSFGSLLSLSIARPNRRDICSVMAGRR